MIVSVWKIALRHGDAVAEPGGRRDELGQHQPGPGPAEADAQRVPDARQRRAARTMRVRICGSDRPSVRPRPTKSGGTRLTLSMTISTCWKKVPMQMIRNFWRVAGAGPEDRQRHEGDDRHVADEVDERLDRGLPDARRCRSARRSGSPARWRSRSRRRCGRCETREVRPERAGWRRAAAIRDPDACGEGRKMRLDAARARSRPTSASRPRTPPTRASEISGRAARRSRTASPPPGGAWRSGGAARRLRSPDRAPRRPRYPLRRGVDEVGVDHLEGSTSLDQPGLALAALSTSANVFVLKSPSKLRLVLGER